MLPQSVMNVQRSCTAQIMYGSSCQNTLGNYTGVDFDLNVTTQTLKLIQETSKYCFIVNASYNSVVILMHGEFDYLGMLNKLLLNVSYSL